jgi:hypothetical protein
MVIKRVEKKATIRGKSPRTIVERVIVKTINVPGYTSRVNADMYKAMQRALMKVLPSRPSGLTQAEMFRSVVPHLPKDLYPGGAKANWWAKTVQLDLEVKGVLVREQTRPLRWHRKSGR